MDFGPICTCLECYLWSRVPCLQPSIWPMWPCFCCSYLPSQYQHPGLDTKSCQPLNSLLSLSISNSYCVCSVFAYALVFWRAFRKVAWGLSGVQISAAVWEILVSLSFAFLLLLILILADVVSGWWWARQIWTSSNNMWSFSSWIDAYAGWATQLQSTCVGKKWERNAREKEGGNSCWNTWSIAVHLRNAWERGWLISGDVILLAIPGQASWNINFGCRVNLQQSNLR